MEPEGFISDLQIRLQLPVEAAEELIERDMASLVQSERRSASSVIDLVVAVSSSAGPSVLVAIEKQGAKLIAEALWSTLKRLRRRPRGSELSLKLAWRDGHASIEADVSDPEALELLTDVIATVQRVASERRLPE